MSPSHRKLTTGEQSGRGKFGDFNAQDTNFRVEKKFRHFLIYLSRTLQNNITFREVKNENQFQHLH
jgi:hypothetical protein